MEECPQKPLPKKSMEEEKKIVWKARKLVEIARKESKTYEKEEELHALSNVLTDLHVKLKRFEHKNPSKDTSETS